MTTRRLSIAMWVVAFSVGGAGVAAVAAALEQRVPAMIGPSSRVAAAPVAPQHTSIDEIRGAAPFRASRRPTASRYNAVPLTVADEPTVARPEWMLTAVLGGRPNVVVFEEQPGRPEVTHVLGLGDEANGYRVEAIAGDSAWISSGDSLWVFGLVAPWR